MNPNQNNGTNSPKKPKGSVVGSNKRTLPKKTILILVGVLLAIALIITLGLFLSSKFNKEQTQQQTAEIKYEETVTPTAYGKLLSVSLRSFYMGGNTNGVKIPARGYYPSTADVSSAEWVNKNLNLDKETTDLINEKKITYESKGCDGSKPSSEQNKCTGFTIKVDGQVTEEK